MKVLLLEDDLGIGHILTKTLEKNVEKVVWVQSAEALFQLRNINDFDIALIDVMLPGKDGFEALKWLRAINESIGAIMLTAKSQSEDKVKGLMGGADDYVTKPFNTKELLARINALYRKVLIIKEASKRSSTANSYGLNEEEGYFVWKGSRVDLTNTETLIIACLLERMGHVVSRDELLDKVWGKNYFGTTKVVDVNIQRIRKKMTEEIILTKWGKGYQWNESV
ncbi:MULTISPECIES: response regulator transcription factor [unclassified Fusibacter]|uniref:response regulator transcription factor n=1 Tax=unclassified Fusibacter TaxID=2624464 RepID=UPI0010107F04|nr:response regulator transcription factor [Fusibacter sp. A1]MCK8060309.1 response regulator transcription factor [Fusibacter sp. A2]NPE20402.1 response regulator transcription factor [Fusibacter sp. A1]RXV63607.1 DNA-binding response regulator [Fusibacter sp. A1]